MAKRAAVVDKHRLVHKRSPVLSFDSALEIWERSAVHELFHCPFFRQIVDSPMKTRTCRTLTRKCRSYSQSCSVFVRTSGGACQVSRTPCLGAGTGRQAAPPVRLPTSAVRPSAVPRDARRGKSTTVALGATGFSFFRRGGRFRSYLLFLLFKLVVVIEVGPFLWTGRLFRFTARTCRCHTDVRSRAFCWHAIGYNLGAPAGAVDNWPVVPDRSPELSFDRP